MTKKANFLSFIVIFALAITLVVFTKAIYEDDDAAFDMLCVCTDTFHYDELFASVLSYMGIFYERHNSTISPQSIMAFLERHEKSPPLIIAIS
jgi:hypothetical protein